MEFIYTAEFWVAVSFFLFVAGLIYLGLHKKVATALDARAERIATELAEARRLREEAEQVLAEYRRKEREATGEADAIIKQAGQEAESLAKETRRTIKEQFERRIRLAEDKIGRAETEAIREVRAAAVEAAVNAARTLITEKLTADQAEKLVKDGIDAVKSKLH
ncbi:MAG TPA: ATP F0F1 synthase subunit B [Methyloceanibacter sp.]|nr:ATP F0F1 synthase subunit B [Methyloceanibacter sp.]